MDLKLDKFYKTDSAKDAVTLNITGSKSESNRLLILKKLFPELEIHNLSNSDDSRYLNTVLSSDDDVLDIGHAGTAMRFGTAYFACQPGREVILTGSDRMKQRPIAILVDALNELGAHITYLKKKGFPPLKIKGQNLKGGSLDIDGGVSSQFLTALLLVGTKFEYGLELKIQNLTSVPYLKMTFNILKDLGIPISWEDGIDGTLVKIEKPVSQLEVKNFTVESDWSSAGYWYSWIAMQEEGSAINLKFYKKDSLQGDSRLADVYEFFGVKSVINNDTLTISKTNTNISGGFEFDFSAIPDQAQTVFVTCLGLGVDARFTGLHTLKVKETDRIEAMRIVGSRFRESEITTNTDSLILKISKNKSFNTEVEVNTFQDHRMAMAFAPLCTQTSIIIRDAGVVSKSYGSFWEDLKRLGVVISKR